MKYYPETLSIKWLKEAYKSGELTPMELADEIIRRSERYAEKNIWIVKPDHNVIDRYIKALPENPDSLPLWGIPFAIKDNIDLKDIPTTAACPDFAYTPEESATVVSALIAAGAIPVGKTNLDQFATGLVGTRSPYGECHNAYQDEMISGGSSSGSAVSVALGMASFALGTDTAGSGRVPAMLNTLVGYKGPVGSWSTKGVVPACASLDCVTVFALNLKEAETVDSIARGYDEKCIWSRHIEKQGKSVAKKIYLPEKEPEFFGQWAQVYRQKWLNAVERIKKLGITVEYIDYSMFSKAALILYEGAYVAERWQDLKDFVTSHSGSVFPVTEKILRSGAKECNTAAALFGDLHQLQAYKHAAENLLQDAVMVMPTAGGSFTRDQVRDDPVATNSKMGLYTNHCNLLDMAAVAVPENTKDHDHPFGITLFTLHDREDILTGTAEAFLNSESMEIAVCGLHKKGYSLESQIVELGGTFLCHSFTKESYRLYRLEGKTVKPGLVYDEKGKSIAVDLYNLPVNAFGSFMNRVSSPLCIGDVYLKDGRCVKGFICESHAVKDAAEITEQGTF